MKATILRLTKNSMKTIMAFGLALALANCSKDDDGPAPTPALSLPAILQNNTLKAIPDATNGTGGCGSGVNMGSGESEIAVAVAGIIADPTKVSIEVDISHTYHSDVVLELIAPSGESVGLIKRLGAASDTGCGFDADFTAGQKLTFRAGNSTGLATPYVTGNYAPTVGASTYPTSVPMVSLATFMTGKSVNGTWKLKMYDCGVLDTGSINAWKLTFETGAF